MTLTQSKSGLPVRETLHSSSLGAPRDGTPLFAGSPGAHDAIQCPTVLCHPGPATVCTVQKKRFASPVRHRSPAVAMVLATPPGRRIRQAIQEQESPRRSFRSLPVREFVPGVIRTIPGLPASTGSYRDPGAWPLSLPRSEVSFCIMQRPSSSVRRSFSLRCSSRIFFLTAASLFLSASRSFF